MFYHRYQFSRCFSSSSLVRRRTRVSTALSVSPIDRTSDGRKGNLKLIYFEFVSPFLRLFYENSTIELEERSIFRFLSCPTYVYSEYRSKRVRRKPMCNKVFGGSMCRQPQVAININAASRCDKLVEGYCRLEINVKRSPYMLLFGV